MYEIKNFNTQYVIDTLGQLVYELTENISVT